MTPPMIARPIGACSSPPSPRPSASGSMPPIIAAVVIRIGRSRTCPAASSASMSGAPARRDRFAKSTSRIAFFDRDLLARLNVAPGDDAAQRRDDIGVVQRIPRELDLCLRRFEIAARDAVRRLGAVERVLRDKLVVAQAHVHCACLLGERQLRAGAFDRADAIDEPGLEIG
jgi:hypothetical protein